MKKTYIAPSCKIRKVMRMNIIATSGMDGVNNTEGAGRMTGGMSRGWDDDDWDED